jgi:hypothetical protein
MDSFSVLSFIFPVATANDVKPSSDIEEPLTTMASEHEDYDFESIPSDFESKTNKTYICVIA